MQHTSGSRYEHKKNSEIRVQVMQTSSSTLEYSGETPETRNYKGSLKFSRDEEKGEYVISNVLAAPLRQGLGAVLISTLIKDRELATVRASTAAVSERRFYYRTGFRLEQGANGLEYHARSCPELIPDINRFVVLQPLVDLVYLGFEIDIPTSKQEMHPARAGFQPFFEIIPDMQKSEEFFENEQWQRPGLVGNEQVKKETVEAFKEALTFLDDPGIVYLLHLRGATQFDRLKEVVGLAQIGNRVTQLIGRTDDILENVQKMSARNWKQL